MSSQVLGVLLVVMLFVVSKSSRVVVLVLITFWKWALVPFHSFKFWNFKKKVCNIILRPDNICTYKFTFLKILYPKVGAESFTSLKADK